MSHQPGNVTAVHRDAQGRPKAAGQDCDFAGFCPACEVEIAYARFADDFPCPACGVVLETEHDCGVDCYDWLNRAAK